MWDNCFYEKLERLCGMGFGGIGIGGDKYNWNIGDNFGTTVQVFLNIRCNL